MRVRITLDLDVGEEAYADVITYSIAQYEEDGMHLVENPTPSDIVDAVEWTILDILEPALHESFNLALDSWAIHGCSSTPIGREGS